MEKLINKKNQLLVKDDVGKAKPATRDLPPDGFTFGRADKKDEENAGKVTSSWKMHEQSKLLPTPLPESQTRGRLRSRTPA